jgi:hypothetical protein
MSRMMVKSCLIVLFFLFTYSYGKPVKAKPKKAPTVKTNAEALKFLDKFGYNKCGDSPQGKKTSEKGPLCQSSFQTMIEHFQTVFRLPVSGKLDTKTITLMNKGRCILGDYPMAYSAFRPW